jgi:hypothetical protein
MKHLPRSIPVLVVWLVAGGAQAQTTYDYKDDQGPGRLVVRELGPAPGVGGALRIRVTLDQNGIYEGEGLSFVVNPGQANPRVLWFFTIPARGKVHIFQGEVQGGIVPGIQGDGVWYSADDFQRKEKLSVKPHR